MWLGILLIWRVHFSLTWSLRLKAAIGSKGWNPIENWKYSRIRLYHPPPDRTKVVDISDWMIKPVGPNSSSNYNSSWLVTCFKSLSLSRIATFSFHVKLVRFVGAVLHEWNTITYVCKQVSLWLPGKVALSAPMFPLAPLKVPDVTGGLNDISRGFYYVKTRYRPKMANISGWMIHPWML